MIIYGKDYIFLWAKAAEEVPSEKSSNFDVWVVHK